MSKQLSITTDTLSQSGFDVEFAGASDVGRVRKVNQDSYFVGPLEKQSVMAIVADGMGGHENGEVASRMAVDGIIKHFKEESSHTPVAIAEAVKTTNQDIFTFASKSTASNSMGTTLTLMYMQDEVGLIGHVGDSRAYLVREGKIQQVTNDHSWVADRVRQGVLTEFEAKNHHWRNVITNALGTTKEVRLDLSHVNLEPGDRILMCSDGISSLFSDEELGSTVSSSSPEEAVKFLMAEADERGSPDNTTTIIVHVLNTVSRPKGYRLPEDSSVAHSIKINDSLQGLRKVEDIYPTIGVMANIRKKPWYPFRFWILGCLGLLLAFLIILNIT